MVCRSFKSTENLCYSLALCTPASFLSLTFKVRGRMSSLSSFSFSTILSCHCASCEISQSQHRSTRVASTWPSETEVSSCGFIKGWKQVWHWRMVKWKQEGLQKHHWLSSTHPPYSVFSKSFALKEPYISVSHANVHNFATTTTTTKRCFFSRCWSAL